jgi:peptide/nickel transport system permease protein
MIRHLVPNIFPVAISSLVLSVPAGVLMEAALSFLGFGDPRVPTWGKMLNYAYGHGAFENGAWWWVVPPGLAITFLSLTFVFMGFAIDEIVNPRLRRRR